jgi:L-ascorbate metabolism protein UlaG (beta-lactamase superfamily)
MDQAWLAWSYPAPLEHVMAPHFLLCTHYHKDHFHPPSVDKISRSSEVVVPTTAGHFFLEKFQEFGFAGVQEISSATPLTLGDFEVYSVRINDHWEFLDETAYLIVEGDRAALFLADLWYLSEGLLRQLCAEFRICFAAVPWGGSLQDLCVLPEGFRLDSLEEYYRYGMDEATLRQKNSVQELEPYVQMARLMDAEHLTPGSYGFGLIQPGQDLVEPAPVNDWLNQEKFVQTLPDPAMRAKSHSMYPGDHFNGESGFHTYSGSSLPNTPVTDSMRSLTLSRKHTRLRLDGEFISRQFLKKIEERLSQLRNSSDLYQSRLSDILRSARQIEFQIVNESRQTFLFEQIADRFRMMEVSAPTGASDIVFIPPSVMTSLVTDWGPCWTEAEFSGLVKISASGWAPYLIMKQLFC